MINIAVVSYGSMYALHILGKYNYVRHTSIVPLECSDDCATQHHKPQSDLPKFIASAVTDEPAYKFDLILVIHWSN